MQNTAKRVRVAALPFVTRAPGWTSTPATTSTAISTSALRRSTSIARRSAPMAGSRNRSLTALSSVGALPSASTRSCSQRKSGAGAAPIAWRPLFIRVAGQSQMLQLCPKDAIAVATGLQVCIYSAHQDSATITAAGPSTASMRALSSANDSADIRERCRSDRVAALRRVGDDVKGVQNVFCIADRPPGGAACPLRVCNILPFWGDFE
jgi:hypothetical protein